MSATRVKRSRSRSTTSGSLLHARTLSPLTDTDNQDSILRAKTSAKHLSPTRESTRRKFKKLKSVSTYGKSSPFPDHPYPTHAEARQVYALLSQTCGTRSPVQRPSDGTIPATTYSSIPNVLDALIETILSQNTSAANSTCAKQDLDAAFGLHNFAAIAAAPQARVYEAIRHGGLAQKKSVAIQALLRAVRMRHGEYSLQHLAAPDVTDAQAMLALQEYDGVGPKTAPCVLMFSLGRNIFAVDTHVFRLSRLLGWVPANANRVTAQAHLEVRIPAELKCGLHILMVQHGRRCKGCKRAGVKGDCILKCWLKEGKVISEVAVEMSSEEHELKARESHEQLLEV